MRWARLATFALLIGSLPAAAAGAKPPVEGFWDTPGGRLYVVRKGKTVSGTLESPGDGVTIAKGKKVLKGTFEDDNLSADVPVELVAPACHGGGSAFLVMLLTHSGKLTGGVSSKDACAASLSTVQFLRSQDQTTGVPVKAKPIAAAGTGGAYDARGKRTVEIQASVKPMMADGSQYLSEGQFEKARALFMKAAQADPTIGEAYNGVGVTYYARNDYDTAISWYKQGLEAAPGFGDLYYNLACAYAQLGKKDIALRYFKLAVNKGYTEVDAIDADPDLEPLRNEPLFIELRQGLGPVTAVPVKRP